VVWPSFGTIAAVFLMSFATIVLCSAIALAPFYLGRNDESVPFDDVQLSPDEFEDVEQYQHFAEWEKDLAAFSHPSRQRNR
jgi:hypothetical protein